MILVMTYFVPTMAWSLLLSTFSLFWAISLDLPTRADSTKGLDRKLCILFL